MPHQISALSIWHEFVPLNYVYQIKETFEEVLPTINYTHCEHLDKSIEVIFFVINVFFQYATHLKKILLLQGLWKIVEC